MISRREPFEGRMTARFWSDMMWRLVDCFPWDEDGRIWDDETWKALVGAIEWSTDDLKLVMERENRDGGHLYLIYERILWSF